MSNVVSNRSIDNTSNKNFFSKRNTLILIFTFLLSIALVSLSIIYVLKIDWENLFIQIYHGSTQTWGWVWLLLITLFIPWTFFCRAFTITIKIEQLGYKVKFWDKFMYAVTISFLALVTPANFVTDPYTIFWLKTHKINTSKAAALTTCNALLWEIAQLIITMPSFIWMIMNWQSIFGQGAIDRQSGLIVFIFMIIGMLFNFIGLAFMIIIGFNKKLHYLVSRIFNWVKKLLHMSYHVKTETYQTYVVEAKMQREFLIIFKMWKSTIFILTIVIIDEIYLYFTIVMCIKFLAEINGDYFKLNIWEIFNVANVTTTANRFVPLPGNEFSIEWIMKEFMCTKIGGIQPWPITSDDDTTVLINNSIMIWRTWTSYFPAMIGAFGFGFLTINQVKQYRKKTLVQN